MGDGEGKAILGFSNLVARPLRSANFPVPGVQPLLEIILDPAVALDLLRSPPRRAHRAPPLRNRSGSWISNLDLFAYQVSDVIGFLGQCRYTKILRH